MSVDWLIARDKRAKTLRGFIVILQSEIFAMLDKWEKEA